MNTSVDRCSNAMLFLSTSHLPVPEACVSLDELVDSRQVFREVLLQGHRGSHADTEERKQCRQPGTVSLHSLVIS